MLIYFAFLAIFRQCICDTLVETPLGKVRGYLDKSSGGRVFSAFEGIPYAKPPSGNLRFEEPVPIDPWDNILNATAATTCAQSQGNSVFGTEDCLHINVYVPRQEIDPDEKLEVIVHIHGGSFLYGSGASYAKPLHAMDKNIVFVTFNYRLGILGFLSTEDEALPGNNGFKDQVLALKWIQKNIGSFGGNPDSVTLTGLSAGSFSVHYHYFSELSKGLFHRGFGQSGLALGPSGITEGSLDRAKYLADSLGCPTDDTKLLVDCLRVSPLENILHQLGKFLPYNNIPIHPFGAVIEKGSTNPFLKDNLYSLLVKGEVQDLPFLTSNVKDEGLLFTGQYSQEDLDTIFTEWDKRAPLLFDFNYTSPQNEWQTVSEQIKNHYFDNGSISSEKLNQVFLDRYWLSGADLTLKLQSNVTKSSVYYFKFAYPKEALIGHGSEVRYMYGSNLSENEIEIKNLLWDMLVSYAENDAPTLGKLTWSPTTYQQDIYAEINGFEIDQILVKINVEIGDRQFWESLNFAENDNFDKNVLQ